MWLVAILWVLLAASGAWGRHLVSSDSPERIIVDNSTVYMYEEVDRQIQSPFSWISVVVEIKDHEAHNRLLAEQLPMPGAVNTSFFVQEPVYVSLTTMASRMHKVNKTIISLIQAKVLPTKIFLFISKESYLLDTGVKHIPDNLLCLAAAGYLRIVYTNNIGPHRKLLPALKRYWGKDVFIATVDDDMSRDQGYILLYQLLKGHMVAKKPSIVALRARRISICDSPPHRSNRYYMWPVVLGYNRAEMLLMPTGTGGILYKPAYFNKVIFHKALRTATGTADDLMFRLASLINRTPVQLGCSILRHRGNVIRRCNKDEYDRKYDTLYGTASSEYYQALLDAAAAAIEADRAQKALEKEKEKVETGEVNEHENDVEVDASIKLLLTDPEVAAPRHRPRQLLIDDIDLSLAEHFEHDYNTSLSGCPMDAIDNSHHEERRELTTHKIKYRGIPNTGSEKDLFAINRRGGNDQSWKLALDVLRLMKLLDFDSLAAEFADERENQCYVPNRSTRTERICGLVDCHKNPHHQNVAAASTGGQNQTLEQAASARRTATATP